VAGFSRHHRRAEIDLPLSPRGEYSWVAGDARTSALSWVYLSALSAGKAFEECVGPCIPPIEIRPAHAANALTNAIMR
jgi:hypothetical protein